MNLKGLLSISIASVITAVERLLAVIDPHLNRHDRLRARSISEHIPISSAR